MANGFNSSRRPAARWWARPGLDYVANELCVAGQPVAACARAAGTPLYLYDGSRVRDNLARLHAALAAQGLRHRIFYAMKSNRHAPLLTWLRQLGGCGIDACSPGEVRWARSRSFAPDNISFTGTSLSDADLGELLRHPGLILNLDSMHDIRRVGALAPGRRRHYLSMVEPWQTS